MAHGAGGKATQSMIEGLFAPAFGGGGLEDAGSLEVDGAELALTTDSFVVKPLRFPGGSIGDLAVNGTVNDLAVSGARPLALSLSLILEEGLGADELRAEVEAIAARGRGRRGPDRHRRHQGRRARRRRPDVHLHDRRRAARSARAHWPPTAIRPGDRDPAVRHDRRARHGDHARPRRVRAGRRRSSRTRARCGRSPTRCSRRPGPSLRCMRDATRGGVASVLNELARARRRWRCS